MSKYVVSFAEIYRYNLNVEADSPEQARIKASEMIVPEPTEIELDSPYYDWDVEEIKEN